MRKLLSLCERELQRRIVKADVLIHKRSVKLWRKADKIAGRREENGRRECVREK